MADAAGTTVVDASFPFESKLLKEWARDHPEEISLSFIDREDDPAVFKDVDPVKDRAVQALANEMTLSIRTVGGLQVQVEARRFEPRSLTAVIKSSEASEGREKAESLLNDPNTPSDLRAMAEEMILMNRRASRRMSINASNPLIRQVADLHQEIGREDEDVMELMLGIYNDAILYNQELMTPDNAKIFHQQFGRLMTRNAEFISKRNGLAEREAELQAEIRRLKPASDASEARKHLVAFLITPFAPEFDVAREGVRMAVEDRLGCKLNTADKTTFERFIHDNVGAHLNDADFFLVDLTGASPNVMLELGAVLYQKPRPPFVPIQRVADKTDKPDLPADISSAIVMRYTAEMSSSDIAADLTAEIEKDQVLNKMLNKEGREKVLSASRLRDWIRLPFPEDIYTELAREFPGTSEWKHASSEGVGRLLGQDSDMAAVVRERVVSALTKSGG
ncbi:MAG: hypothetical protein AAGM22_15810 [Acidobacteriota bacterium]